jgi:dihydrofolate reductase
MRKLIYAINLSLDGCCDHAKSGGGGDEMLEHYTHLLREADLLVYGRKTYQLMVPYWPDVAKSQTESPTAIEFAQTFDALPKIVFSRTLASAEPNATIVSADLKDEILKLKQQPGKSILGLVDEFRIVVAPYLAGEGRRLMEGVSLPKPLRFKLADSKIFDSGAVALRYLQQ